MMRKSLIPLSILILVGIVFFFYVQKNKAIKQSVPFEVTQETNVIKAPSIEAFEVILDPDIVLNREWIYRNERYIKPFSITEIEEKTKSDFEIKFSLLMDKSHKEIDGLTFAFEKKF